MFTCSTEPTLRPVRATEDLQRAYIWAINNALESGGVELAAELANDYERESSDLTKTTR